MNQRRIVLVLVVVFVASCAKSAKYDTAESAKAPAEVSAVDGPGTEEAARTLAEGEIAVIGVEDLVRTNNLFAWDLYRSMRADQFAVSAHALAGSLAMVHAAAGGESAEQVASTLRVELDERALQDRFFRLHNVLRSRATSTDREQPRGFRLLVSHGVWLSAGVQPSAGFLGVANNTHLATIKSFDFSRAADAAKTVNDHYRDASGDRIGKVIDKFGADDQFHLTSATLFDGPWALPFQRGLTEDGQFHGPKGVSTVPMMHNRARVAYLKGEGFQLLELPYADGLVSAWVVLPESEKPDLDTTITADFFDWMVGSARQQEVDIRIPRFEIISRHTLAATLQSMGIGQVFDAEKADLGGLGSAKTKLRVDEIVQITRVRVDEDGSDAMAPTRGSVTMPDGKLPSFDAVRPFLFVVRDNPTGTILAMARVTAP